MTVYKSNPPPRQSRAATRPVCPTLAEQEGKLQLAQLNVLHAPFPCSVSSHFTTSWVFFLGWMDVSGRLVCASASSMTPVIRPRGDFLFSSPLITAFFFFPAKPSLQITPGTPVSISFYTLKIYIALFLLIHFDGILPLGGFETLMSNRSRNPESLTSSTGLLLRRTDRVR